MTVIFFEMFADAAKIGKLIYGAKYVIARNMAFKTKGVKPTILPRLPLVVAGDELVNLFPHLVVVRFFPKNQRFKLSQVFDWHNSVRTFVHTFMLNYLMHS